MAKLTLQFTLFSAFYSPLISVMTGGFLAEEGLDYDWSVSPPGVSAVAALEAGSVDVVQSTLSQSITSLNKGIVPASVHFAQVNNTDGFFLTSREPSPDFKWQDLEGADVLVNHGGQPMTMFRYACHRAAIDISRINMIDAGNGAEMDRAFRDGRGDFIHQQGPAPQQLQADGAGYVVAALGPLVGACAFSSLAARPQWLESPAAAAFTRAYKKSCAYLTSVPAAEIAAAQLPLFPKADKAVLTDCISSYQKLGCWQPEIEITKAGFSAMLDIYETDGKLARRYDYDEICARPPLA